MQLQLNLPSLYHECVASEYDDLCIEYAPICIKLHETILASFLSSVTNPLSFDKNYLIISRKVNSLKAQMDIWLNSMGISVRRKTLGFYFSSTTSTLWLCNPDSLDYADLPFLTLNRLVICDAHSVNETVFKTLNKVCKGQTIVAGEFADRGYWSYELARSSDSESKLLRYDASSIAESFPEQEEALAVSGEELTETEARRSLDLEDVNPKKASFEDFSTRRLFIKTDRSIKVLTDRQKEFVSGIGTPIVPFEPSYLQQYYMNLKKKAIEEGKDPFFLLLKSRRGGFTTLEQGISYQQCISNPNSWVVTLAHTAIATARIFRIAKLFYERDPRSPKLSSESKSQLEFADNGSLFFIGTAGGRGFSRGDTLQRVHGSEVSRWCEGNMERVEDLVSGILGAAEHGEVVLETTAKGIEWFASNYMEARKGQNPWTPIFLPWFLDPINRESCDVAEIKDTLSDEEKELVRTTKRNYKMKLKPSQIAFRRKQKRKHKRLFPQEYPEDEISCFLSSGTPFFDIEMLSLILRMLGEDETYKQPIPGGYLAIWEQPIKGVRYVAGCDTSEGLPTGDLNGTGLLNKETGRQVAAVHGRFRPRKLAQLSIDLCIRYNRAVLGVERNNHGHAVIQKIVDFGYGRAHLVGGSMYATGDSKNYKLGWLTSSITRPVMLDNLYEVLMEPKAEDRIRDLDFLREAMSFKLQPSGKYEADPGCYDDTVFKWAIAEQMRRNPISIMETETV